MKPSRQEKIKAVKIAKAYIDAGFDHVLKNELYFSDWVRDFGNPLSSCEIASGMTKYVIIPDDLNWVIKLPIQVKPKQYRREEFLTKFNAYDYCDLETRNFAYAEEKGVNVFFAESYFLSLYKGIRIYIQRKAKCDEQEFDDRLKKYASHYVSETCNEDVFDEVVSDYVLNMDESESLEAVFGDVPTELYDLIEERNVNDLHCGNYGFINEKPVIIDYSGY